MPGQFLSKAQRRQYAQYQGEPTADQLARYFHLDDADRSRIRRIHGNRNRLGFALQLCTVRFLGTFLPNLMKTPPAVIDHVMQQLKIRNVEDLTQYANESTRWRHAERIKVLYGYREFTDRNEGFRLARRLYTRAWLSDERPSVLFDFATAQLIERKVLLPGATVLERFVAKVRDRATRRLWRRLSALPSPDQIEKLETLLQVPEGKRGSSFERLRRSPVRISGPALVAALERLQDIRALGVASLDVSGVSPNRLKSLARQAFKANAQTVSRMTRNRRTATLLAFAIVGETIALDEALDVLDALITDIINKAKHRGQKKRLATLHDLDIAAICLQEACLPLLDESVADHEVRNVAFASIPPHRLQEAVEVVTTLTRPKGDHYHQERIAQYTRIRRFLPALLRTITFAGTHEGEPVLSALTFLKSIEGQRDPNMTKAPRAVIPGSWRGWVIGEADTVDRRSYTLCVLEQLQERLRRRDVFASPSERWGDPRLKLLRGEKWRALRPQICRSLGRHVSAEHELEILGTQLDECYRRTVTTLPNNPDVRIERCNGHDRLVVSPLDKLEEPDSLVQLKKAVKALLPQVDLPEVLLEIHTKTGFADAFTHISERHAQADDIHISICAALTAEACNTGLDPVTRSDIPALRRGRLNWVKQNYLRNETITRSNTKLVNYQNKLALARSWGGGDVASADGLRFLVPIRSIHAGPNPKYFNTGRGVTYLNFTSDQETGFFGLVVPGTIRDSLFILAGLLEQETDLEPTELMTDTAGASDIIFGLFWMLGYQYSPRLADIGGARFWRIDPEADYGPLDDLSRHRTHIERIIRNWDDMLRAVGSLKMGTVSVSELMRSLLRTKRPTSLARAFGELGRIPKTIHHLNYISDSAYRRRSLTQLNHGESRHGMAREVFHGRRGDLYQRYREGQEEQLGALGLVVNALVLWNTIYMQEALDHLRNQGLAVRPEDVARLSPLGYKNFNFHGRYSFDIPTSVAQGHLRPLRDPKLHQE